MPKLLLSCPICNEVILRHQYHVTRNNNNSAYCSASCATSGNNTLYRSGENNPGYKNGISSYRERALKHYGSRCAICGYGVESVLEVHHRDSDRNNNSIENLDVLCPTHHKEFTVGIRSY